LIELSDRTDSPNQSHHIDFMSKALGILDWILSILASGIFLMGVAFLVALVLHLIPRMAPAAHG